MALDPKHYVNVGPHGTFQASGDLHTTPADVDGLIQHLDQSGVERVVLHFHGGLNSEKRGEEIAEALLPIYSAAGSHPIFFIWETGLLETAARNLETIHSTELFQKLATYALRYAAKKLGVDPGGKGIGEAPSPEDVALELEGQMFRGFDATARGGAEALVGADFEMMEQDLEAEIEAELTDELGALEAAVQEAKAAAVPPDESLLGKLDDDGAKGIGTAITVATTVAKLVVAVVKRYLAKRDHGFYPTVVEEVLRMAYVAGLGKWLWDGMKNVGATMWSPNDGLSGDAQHAGAYFLERLAALQQARPALVVDLVGHSAGSIAICEMLKAAAERAPLDVRKVAFLAPAARADLFVEEMVGHPERFASLRIFTMRDEVECEDQLVKGVYTRSLLYFISGVLEDERDTELVGMHRYYVGEPPYGDGAVKDMADYLRADPRRVVLSKTTDDAEPGFRTQSVSHGAFDDDPCTRESLQEMLKG